VWSPPVLVEITDIPFFVAVRASRRRLGRSASLQVIEMSSASNEMASIIDEIRACRAAVTNRMVISRFLAAT
jgi:hypothetical protein